MTRRRTVLLAFALAAALGAAWGAIARFATERRGEERAAREDRGSPVLRFDPADATAVGIAALGDEVRLSRGAAGWAFTAPAPGAADARDVDRLLRALAGLHRRATSAPAGMSRELLGPYGLDAPRWKVEVTLGGGRVESLAVGGTTGSEGIAFVMPTSGEVVMVSTTERRALEAAAEALGARVRLPSAPPAGGQAPARAGADPARGR